MASLVLNLGDEAVVLDGALQLLVLEVEFLVLLLHLLLLQFSQLPQFLVFLHERPGVEVVIAQQGCRDGDECHDNAEDNEACGLLGGMAFGGLFDVCMGCFCHFFR